MGLWGARENPLVRPDGRTARGGVVAILFLVFCLILVQPGSPCPEASHCKQRCLPVDVDVVSDEGEIDASAQTQATSQIVNQVKVCQMIAYESLKQRPATGRPGRSCAGQRAGRCWRRWTTPSLWTPSL